MDFRVPSLLLALCLSAGCSTPHPRDVGGSRKSSRAVVPVPEVTAAPPASSAPDPKPAPARMQVLVKSSARALATDGERLFFGDLEDNTVVWMPAAGGERVRVAHRAPMSNGLVLDGAGLAWIAAPGDTVMRVGTIDARSPQTLRDRGVFVGIAASDGEVFFVEALGQGGALTRASSAGTARVVVFEASPRGVAVDKDYAFVTTARTILRVDRAGRSTILANGSRFGAPVLDGDYLYATAAMPDETTVLVRLKKAGGPVEVVERNARDAPIAAHKGKVYFFDVARPALRRIRSDRSGSDVLVTDHVLARANAMAVDDRAIWVATGDGEEAVIVWTPTER